jgi:hypothetical protein
LCQKSPPFDVSLDASIALKISKNELEVRKLRTQSFLQKILDQTAHSLFFIPSKQSVNITLLPLELEEDL